MEKREAIRFKLWNGFTILTRPFSIDRTIINEEWLDHCYEPNDSGIPWDWETCHTIIDVGAHIGGFTLYAAAHAPHARILAYEPEPSNAIMLERNIKENNLTDRVRGIQAGIGGKNETMTLHVSYERSASGGHSLFDYTGKGGQVPVSVFSLSSVLESNHIEQCDFLKMDCEGAEYEALYGLTDKQLRSIRFIAMEYHHFSSDPTHTPEHLKAFLEKHGFTLMSPAKSLFFAYRSA